MLECSKCAAEDTVRISNERFEQVAEVSREMIWEIDPQGLYTYVSRLSRNILGYDAEELIGKQHFYDLHPESQKEEFKKATFDAFERKTIIRELVNPAVSRDGNRRQCRRGRRRCGPRAGWMTRSVRPGSGSWRG
jgi:PAS domain S-box-containing protein